MLKNITLAFIFVFPLYLVYFFEFALKTEIPLILNSIFGLLSLYIFLSIPQSSKFSFGFFVGLFWFYWVGFSFVYFGFSYLVPLISLIVACIYMLIFALALWFENLLFRLVSLMLLSFVHPFEFDWMKIDSFFAYSYFGVSKEDFFLLILSVIVFKTTPLISKKLYFISIVLLILAIQSPSTTPALPPFKIDLLHTNFSQNLKWQKQNTQKNITLQVQMIQDSIQEGNQLIVLPETAFPFVLSESKYFSLFKTLSKDVTLVIGSIQRKDNQLYNSTYIFQNQEVQIFDKVILAPFGEKIPLPDFLAKPLFKIFLGDGAPQFSSSTEFGEFIKEGIRFRSVICYEGTNELAYKNSPPYLIIISNNAWFPYTIEPALQKNLMKYYAKLYRTTILHSSNGSPSFVVFP